MIDSNRPYWRIEIDIEFNKVKAQMHAVALTKGKVIGINKAIYTDLYTGKQLIGGDPYDYEHIRSSEAIFNKYKHILTNEQIALVVNCSENVGVTLSSINKSKGKRSLEQWLSNPNNVTNHGINLKLALANLKKADEGIERRVNYLCKN